MDLLNWWWAAKGTVAGPLRLASLDGAPALRSVGAIAIGTVIDNPTWLETEIPLADLSGLDGV